MNDMEKLIAIQSGEALPAKHQFTPTEDGEEDDIMEHEEEMSEKHKKGKMKESLLDIIAGLLELKD